MYVRQVQTIPGKRHALLAQQAVPVALAEDIDLAGKAPFCAKKNAGAHLLLSRALLAQQPCSLRLNRGGQLV